MSRKTYVQPMHQSSLSACLGCKRYYMLCDRWCLKPKRRFARAASQGSITHRLLQLGREGKEQVRDEVWKDINIAINHVEAGEDLLGDWAMIATTLEQQWYKALCMCNLLWDSHPENPKHITLAREEKVGFNIKLGQPGEEDAIVVALEGTLDHVIYDTVGEKGWIRDYNTSSRPPEFTTTGYQWSLQCRMYRLLAGAFLQNLNAHKGQGVAGFILDVLQVPMISMCGKDRDFDEVEHTFKSGKRKGETETRREFKGRPIFENYLKRVQAWYPENDKEPVQSNAVMFTESTLPDEFRNDLRIGAVYQAIDAVPQNFPRDETTRYCKNYEKQCPYYDLCSSNPAGWDEIINQKFDVVVPDTAKESS